MAVAVSGGADSLCLAWLTQRWAQSCGAVVEGVVVDHGLREAAAAEAAATRCTLATAGIEAAIIRIDVGRGPELAARARHKRMAAIARHCAGRGIVHVLVGHHAADQAETVAMRLLRGSGPAGLAAMPAIREDARVRWLRPLLPVPAERLRATLRAAGLSWVEDPSNADPAALRGRLRTLRADPGGGAPSTLRSVEAAAARGRDRAAAERRAADWLAEHATLHELGFAVLHRSDPPDEALAAVVRAVGGSRYPASAAALARWIAKPAATTFAGVAIGPAGRLGPGWLLTREPAAMVPSVPAVADAVWDRRFRLRDPAGHGTTFGPDNAAPANWPARVARTLPGGAAAAIGKGGMEWAGNPVCPPCFDPPAFAVW